MRNCTQYIHTSELVSRKLVKELLVYLQNQVELHSKWTYYQSPCNLQLNWWRAQIFSWKRQLFNEWDLDADLTVHNSYTLRFYGMFWCTHQNHSAEGQDTTNNFLYWAQALQCVFLKHQVALHVGFHLSTLPPIPSHWAVPITINVLLIVSTPSLGVFGASSTCSFLKHINYSPNIRYTCDKVRHGISVVSSKQQCNISQMLPSIYVC